MPDEHIYFSYRFLPFEFVYFFFSSRRRHTRYIGDWSSDVCSSDLVYRLAMTDVPPDRLSTNPESPYYDPDILERGVGIRFKGRSEERRVGKECRTGWGPDN